MKMVYRRSHWLRSHWLHKTAQEPPVLELACLFEMTNSGFVTTKNTTPEFPGTTYAAFYTAKQHLIVHYKISIETPPRLWSTINIIDCCLVSGPWLGSMERRKTWWAKAIIKSLSFVSIVKSKWCESNKDTPMLIFLPLCRRLTKVQITHVYHECLEAYVMALGLLQSGALISGPEAVVCVSAKSKLARYCLRQWFLLWTRD